MSDFARPRLLVSECIEFAHCRWNGMMISSDVVKLLKPLVDWVPVCPEVGIGLGIPRQPVRIALRDGEPQLYQPDTDTLYTDAMRSFCQGTLDELPELDGAILKTRSPTCGLKEVKVYPALQGQGMPRKEGSGFWAAALSQRLPALAIEDEGRLTNYVIRDHFLTRIYALSDFRRARAEGSMGTLVDYHARYKLLIMAYDEIGMRALGRLVANHEKRPVAELWPAYQEGLQAALTEPARPGPCINVLMHAFGHFGEGLGHAEKEFFLETLDDYREERAPLSVPVSILRAWIARFDNDYLRQQAFLNPYPEDLVQITDSGKGRKL